MADEAGSSWAAGALKTAFLAVASCTLVHIGFVAFGAEEAIHEAGHWFSDLFNGESGAEGIADGADHSGHDHGSPGSETQPRRMGPQMIRH